MFSWLQSLWSGYGVGDLSKHRLHTVTDKSFRYEDLCM